MRLAHVAALLAVALAAAGCPQIREPDRPDATLGARPARRYVVPDLDALAAPPPARPAGPDADRVLAVLRATSPRAELVRRAAEYDFALPADARDTVTCFAARAVRSEDGTHAGPSLACLHGAEVLAGSRGLGRYLALRDAAGLDTLLGSGDRLLVLADRFEARIGRRYVDVAARREGGAWLFDGRVVLTEQGDTLERRFAARIAPDGTRAFTLFEATIPR